MPDRHGLISNVLSTCMYAAELKLADSKKWKAIKRAKKADDKAAKYVGRAERKEKEAAEARELAQRYGADAKRMGSEAQAARVAADATSKRVEELLKPTGEPVVQPGCWPKKKKA
ncbi:hypothetical protein RHMOL_Rhmol12G0235300 [Rhododendron molle]|uniref:Uncharacterized protein n=1 Tax=Rhododendron molle TaxID=49168 RepID=A0ACC0LMM3_RHOML|nr:hypothetical protein RHMOL_Rhmol12G0235300 [Rhododendron molle]